MSDAPLDLERLRARRQELQALDDVISYVRRVAQARGDLARAEAAKRRGETVPASADEELRQVLGDRLLGGPGRPPRPIEDFRDAPRSAELARLCAEHGFGRLHELEADELDALVGALDDFEQRTSAERHRVYAELDDLTEQLVGRYQQQYGGTTGDDEDGR